MKNTVRHRIQRYNGCLALKIVESHGVTGESLGSKVRPWHGKAVGDLEQYQQDSVMTPQRSGILGPFFFSGARLRNCPNTVASRCNPKIYSTLGFVILLWLKVLIRRREAFFSKAECRLSLELYSCQEPEQKPICYNLPLCHAVTCFDPPFSARTRTGAMYSCVSYLPKKNVPMPRVIAVSPRSHPVKRTLPSI